MRLRYLASIIISVILCLVIFPTQVTRAAATWKVTTTADDASGGVCGTTCTLRDAIHSAGLGDTITFQSGLTGTITLTNGGLTISQSVTITSPDASLLAVDGNSIYTVFTISNSSTVNISGLTIQHGQSVSGGGIYNSSGSALMVSNSTIAGNSALGFGGGIYNNGGTLMVSNSAISGNSAAYGGGIYSYSGVVTVSNSTFSGNTSANYGGGIHNFSSALTVTNSTFSGNVATSGGGGIYNSANGVTISNSTFSGNAATNGSGGGIDNFAALTLGSTIVANNTASTGPDIAGTVTSLGNNLIGKSDGASGLVSSDLTGAIASPLDPQLNPLALNAPGSTQTMALAPDSPAIGRGACTPGSSDQRGFSRKAPCDTGAFETVLVLDSVVHTINDSGVGSLRYALTYEPTNTTITFDPGVFNTAKTITLTTGTLTIAQNLTIQGPGATLLAVDGNNASAVFTVNGGTTIASVSGLTIQHGNPTSGAGGGIYNIGTLTVSNSTFSGNVSVWGGGIYNDHGTLTVSNSTFSGNSTTSAGGGIYNIGTLTVSNSTFSGNVSSSGGGLFNNGTLTVSNSTFSGNSASWGGGIDNGSTLTVSNSTFSGNSATYGGGVENGAGPLTLGSTIVANNRAPTGPDLSGTVDSLGNNLISYTDAAVSGLISSDLQNTDPLLSPLGNNGGPTQTMSLQASSPAIGMGNCNLGTPAAPVTTDERGLARKSPACDVGAYETTGYDPVVHNTHDHGGGSLRFAVMFAPPGTTVTFDPAVFNSPQTITLTTGTLNIAQNLNIRGPGANILAVDGNSANRVFTINSGTVGISGLTIQHGNATSGGGLYNNGAVTINNSAFSANSATNGGAIYGSAGSVVIYSSTFTGNTAVSGGGLYNHAGSILIISTSTISGNSASSYGGGVWNGGATTLSIGNSTVANNKCFYLILHTSCSGGGIYNTSGGTLYLGSAIVAGNTMNSGALSAPSDISGDVTTLGSNLIGSTNGATATWQSSDQQNVDPLLNPLADNGGPTQTMSLQSSSPAIWKGNCGLSLSLPTDQRGVTRQTPVCDAGAFELFADTVVHNTNDCGVGSLRFLISAVPPGSAITFDPTVFNTARTIALTSGSLTINKNVTIHGPGATLLAVDGNHVFSVFTISNGVTVTLSGMTIQHGVSSINGGGIGNFGTLTISGSVISSNLVNSGDGGGIFNFGTLTVSSSTISGNTSSAGSGAGILNNGTLIISNSTISGNSASAPSSVGGGIDNLGTLTVSNSTISGNSAQSGGGILNVGAFNLGSSIVAMNTASASPDIGGALTSLGKNLIGNASGATGFISGDQQNVDPKLNALANNGGPTQTMALQAGSPAIQKGNCKLGSPAAPVTTDQRGAARKALCDVGAYESSATAPVSTLIPSFTRTPTTTRTPSVTATPSNTRTPTLTKTATRTATNTATRTASKTPSVSATPSPSRTRTITNTPTITRTPTTSKTPTVTRTLTLTRTTTTTRTPTVTRTPTITRTPSRTATSTSTSTATVVTPPGAVTLVAPSGATTNIHPAFQWKTDPKASKYYLWVSGSGGVVFNGWFDSAGCVGSWCVEMMPGVTLTNGPYTFWVETWNSSFYGPWSNGLNFNVVGQTPDAAIQYEPHDTIRNRAPTLSWKPATNAQWYYLLVEDPNSTQIVGQWYDGSAICVSAVCSVTPALNLLGGTTYNWWVQTWGGGIMGPISAGMSFTVDSTVSSSQNNGEPTQPVAPTFAPSSN